MIDFVYAVMSTVCFYWRDVLKILFETLVIYLVVRLRYKSKSKADVIIFPKHVIDRLVDEFRPEELITDVPSTLILPGVYPVNALDVASFDVFCLGMNNKDEIAAAIRKYGVGTCGPRGFYGTLDVHLELESVISMQMGVEASIVYPNSFTAVNSVITCFCMQQDAVFYHKDCNEAIIRGICLSKAKAVEFVDLYDLEAKLETFFMPKHKSFVIVEGLFRNTGAVIDIQKLLDIRRKYRFRIILDESYAIPLLHKQGVCGINKVAVREIDIMIGSLSHGLCSTGAFVTGTSYTIDYQRLAGSSYCFSASTPSALIVAALLNINASFDYHALQSITEVFHQRFASATYEIVSSRISPMVIIAKRHEYRMNVPNDVLLKEILEIREEFAQNGVIVGFNHNPAPSLRMCLNVMMCSEDISKLFLLINKW
ncbi:serine palmitoyltransferase component [Ordospora colligata]|uniref:serine C-palmitoyltransferase n=1 Tax=Ordospora colligata OC4 TaxID=1354746 RepID=A0A0B2UGH3_9MICR|nr:aminotransferase [Ordospora colligata OC4]KHN70171.1 aminotransferase [Ordospora colligata OC4]TBU16715.1 aminotransferase [Ordospora colligata]